MIITKNGKHYIRIKGEEVGSLNTESVVSNLKSKIEAKGYNIFTHKHTTRPGYEIWIGKGQPRKNWWEPLHGKNN